MEDKRILRIIWVILILLIILQTAKLLSNYMLSIQGAAIFALLLHPVYKKLRDKTGKKNFSVIIILICVLFIILIPLSLVSFSLINQASGLAEINSEHLDKVENFLASIKVDVNLNVEGTELIHKVKTLIFSNITNLLSKATDFFINAFIFFFLMYYLLINGPEIVNFIKRYLPFSNQKNDEFLLESKKIVKAVVYGSGLTALIQGILGGIGLAIFGVEKALFWGFLMVILSILPFIGSWIIWGPAVLYLIGTGNTWLGIGLLIWSVVIVAQSDNLLKPMITSKLGKVHPVVMVLGLIAGLALFGIIGILSGPIILGLLVLLVDYFHDEKSQVIQNIKKKKRLW